MTDYKFYAFFVASKQGKSGLTPAVDVYDSLGVAQVLNGNAAEIGGGLYSFSHTDVASDDYFAIFKTTDVTVDSQHVPSMATKQIAELPGSIWDVPIADHLTAGSTGLKLNSLISLGNGSVAWTYTLTEPDLVTPIPSALVQVSTDITGLTMIAGGYTDINGSIIFNLDPGTYYLWSFKIGYSFSNPDAEVVP